MGWLTGSRKQGTHISQGTLVGNYIGCILLKFIPIMPDVDKVKCLEYNDYLENTAKNIALLKHHYMFENIKEHNVTINIIKPDPTYKFYFCNYTPLITYIGNYLTGKVPLWDGKDVLDTKCSTAIECKAISINKYDIFDKFKLDSVKDYKHWFNSSIENRECSIKDTDLLKGCIKSLEDKYQYDMEKYLDWKCAGAVKDLAEENHHFF